MKKLTPIILILVSIFMIAKYFYLSISKNNYSLNILTLILGITWLVLGISKLKSKK